MNDEDRRDVWIILICATLAVGLWALDKSYEEMTDAQQQIEHQQRQLAEPKFTEM